VLTCEHLSQRHSTGAEVRGILVTSGISSAIPVLSYMEFGQDRNEQLQNCIDCARMSPCPGVCNVMLWSSTFPGTHADFGQNNGIGHSKSYRRSVIGKALHLCVGLGHQFDTVSHLEGCSYEVSVIAVDSNSDSSETTEYQTAFQEIL
jgi:hypothetical protein